MHGEDPSGGRHLEDQVPIMGNGHEPVQGWPPDDGVKREVDLCDVELDVFCTEVFFRPKCDRERYAPEGGIRAADPPRKMGEKAPATTPEPADV